MKFAIFDFDETLYKGFSIELILKEMEKKSLIEAGFTKEFDELFGNYKNKNISYNEFVNVSQGVIANALDKLSVLEFQKFVRDQSDFKANIQPWVPELFSQLHKKDYIIIVLSGAVAEFMEEVQNILDFDTFFASRCEIKKGAFTTNVLEAVNSEVKSKYVKMLTQDCDFSIGMGDSEGDIPMLKLMDKAFLYEPFEDVIEAAKANNIPIVDANNVLDELYKVIDSK